MKYLYLSFVFPPRGGPEPRHNLSLVRRLRARGFEPVVVTAPLDLPEPRDLSLERQVPAGLATVRVDWPRHRSSRYAIAGRQLLGVPANPLGFAGAGRLFRAAAGVLARDPDIRLLYSVHGIGAAHLAARRLKQQSRLPWVAEFRDPWFHNASLRAYLRDHSWQWWYRWQMARTRQHTRAVVRAADLMVVESPLHGDYLVRDFGADPARVVPYGMGYEPDYFAAPPEPLLELPRRPVIGFIGTVYHGTDPVVRAIVAALARLEQRGHRFTLLTVGEASAPFSRLAGEVGLRSHLPLATVDLDAALGIMRQLDFGLVLRKPEDVCNINSKLWEYLASGVYLLGVVPEDGSMDRLIRQGSCGRVLPHGAEAMAAEIELELADYGRGIRKRPPADFVERYSAEHMVGALGDRLAALVAN